MIRKNSRILITGGSGFVGIHLTSYLLLQGFSNITIVDVVRPKTKGVKFIKSDFSDFKKIEKNLSGADYVFHLAAMVGVDKCRLNPKEVRRVNSRNAKEFIDLCVKNKIKRFIFTSSSEIYGNSKRIPFEEKAKPQPISEYAKSKVDVERYLNKIANKSTMTVGIVRFFNVYGPGQRKDFVVSGFIDKALYNEPLTIIGDGKQIRCFTYVSDAIKGLYKVFMYNKSKYEIFNIGSSKESTINDITKIVLDLIPASRSKITYQKYGGEIRDAGLEIIRRVPDVSKAAKVLRFKASIPLHVGIGYILNNASNEK